MPRLLALAIALSTPATALALPDTLSHQGRLLDAVGDPLTGTDDMTFTLFTVASGGTPIWSETHSGVAFENGYYAVTLGTFNAIDGDDIEVDDLYLGIQLGSAPAFATRLGVQAVPFAAHASLAQNVAPGAAIDASSVQINGTPVIDSSGRIDASSVSGLSDSDTLAALDCAPSGIAMYDGATWVCTEKQRDASALTTGVLDIERVPTGTTANHVALGNHDHDTVYYTQAEVDAMIAGIAFSNGVSLGGKGTCNATDAGTIGYDSGLNTLQFCDGESWKDVSPRPLVGAGTVDSPFTYANGSLAGSCREYNEKSWPWANGNDAVYRLAGGDGYNAWCDQSTDGGGWTLVLKMTGGTSTAMNRNDVSTWRSKNYRGSITNTTSENAIGPSYEHVPFNEVLIQGLTDPDRNLAWRHGSEYPSMFAVVDGGVPVWDGVRTFGSIDNLDYPSYPNRYYYRGCALLHYGFLMADWNYNGGQGIAGHTSLRHGHTGAVIGASLMDTSAQMDHDYDFNDGVTTRCITDWGMGAGYVNMGSGDDLYATNAHWWGSGNTQVNQWGAHGVFVR